MRRFIRTVPLTVYAVAGLSAQQPPDSAVRVIAIAAPRAPLPAEKATATIRRFSFVAYGDTRNSHDGTLPQEAHGLVVESLLAKAASLANGPDAVRFIVSGGDAVTN